MTKHCLSGLLILAAGGLAAADAGLMVRDMRLMGATGQSAGTYTTVVNFDDGTSGETFEEDAVLKHRISLVGIGSLGSISGAGAPLVGVSLTQHQVRTDSSRILTAGQTSSEGLGNATSFGLHVGWGIQVVGGLHVEALIHGSYGGFTGEETITVITDDDPLTTETSQWHSSKNGWYGEVGVTGAVAYTFSTGIQLVLQGAFVKGKGENTIREKQSGTTISTIGDASVDSEYEIEDMLISAGLGYRF